MVVALDGGGAVGQVVGNVGAVGVAKAGADIITIAGSDGRFESLTCKNKPTILPPLKHSNPFWQFLKIWWNSRKFHSTIEWA